VKEAMKEPNSEQKQIAGFSAQMPKDKSAGDIAYTASKALVSMIPIAGGAATEIISLIIKPPLTKRYEEWLESMAQALAALIEKVNTLNLDDLTKNEAFITAVWQATTIAIRTHQEEKREALRNAILNTAIPDKTNENLQLIFLNLIDTFTPWHLRMLKYAADPKAYVRDNNIEFFDPSNEERPPIEDIFPEFKQYPRELGALKMPDQIFQELNTRGLVSRMGAEFYIANHIEDRRNILRAFKGEKLNLEPRDIGGSIQIVTPPTFTEITFLGRQFLKFINSPI
jgi:hypothetical protein